MKPEGKTDIQRAYCQWSETYDSDRNRTRDLDQMVTRETLARLHFKSIVELGCGTGKNTALCAQIGDLVCALDFSEGMIARAKEKVPSGNVTFALTDLIQPWPREDRSADLVVCNLVLEHIQDISFTFSEASRVLVEGGRFFISELHPFRQYQGTQANFRRDQETIGIQAFVHNISDFTGAAENNGFALKQIKEWWHEEDGGKPPRLVSFMFEKPSRMA